ncbi:Fur family transcriptional regulator [Marinagarivorans algicola]|uniref:Fur family transcriptional regulator n=1 Tax=Marinagarivorans algicola TaxID=1513270 RepID=UPI0006B618BE|nr:transcriptional repressor [Marinagarivorans algicola]
MNEQQLSKTLSKAQAMCSQSGSRLTDKRQRILELLLMSEVPLSAYEVADAYNRSSNTSMPPMSVYRILDFLESEQLAHKLSSTNKYVACSHITCSHGHNVPQFLICGKCQSVKEIAISKHIIDELSTQVSNAGYTLIRPQLELDCHCQRCAA